MKDCIKDIVRNVNLEEGKIVIENILIDVYFKTGISTKDLARKNLLPLPVVAAIKKELIKFGVLQQDNGTRLTPTGKAFIAKELDFNGLNKILYHTLMADTAGCLSELTDVLEKLEKIFTFRPKADVSIDQSKCTAETSLRRALLCLRNNTLIGKEILCLGDDDAVSIALALLIKKLNPSSSKSNIHVIEIDERILGYIEQVAAEEQLSIQCHAADLREPLRENLKGRFDCFFTDPPYTLQGMNLFLSRGIEALKKEKGLPIFLSYAHKSPDIDLCIQKSFVELGLMVSCILPRFNLYEGAGIIGNTSQMTILKTTSETTPLIETVFHEPIYTGEQKKTVRTYQCKVCGKIHFVGSNQNIRTIEVLKLKGCSTCHGNIFDFISKSHIS